MQEETLGAAERVELDGRQLDDFIEQGDALHPERGDDPRLESVIGVERCPEFENN